MISHCQRPTLSKTGTNTDLLQYSLLLISEIEKCNADWQRLKQWRDSQNAK